ncbi:DUF4129 domain-containing protein [Micromonospora krabiensis]|uniref:Protein-glutamine gamma-glutamyltransferase-like C-terminal domain-containing protein n=1 Tax=Micromonospora krabiensis TaxID=307121 RepID=A0A1C3N5D5_9ACTN|nr:DUF4129 domain-containing protein [Micromonospora krabiensis]SBV27799.1 protein of unknown function [Micromonospora krabiensis]
MSFSRWWTETVAAVGDHVPLPLLALLLVLAAALTGLAWHTFPAWVPRRLPRFRLRRPRFPRLRRRRRPAPDPTPTADPTPEAPTPIAPAAAYLSLADRLAAEGRYAEAVRERLRAMIAELVAHQVVPRQPGLTVREVATTAARNRPATGPTVAAAGEIFAELWYAQRPASADHDRRMRDLAAELHGVLGNPPAAAAQDDAPPTPAAVVPQQAAAREDRP